MSVTLTSCPSAIEITDFCVRGQSKSNSSPNKKRKRDDDLLLPLPEDSDSSASGRAKAKDKEAASIPSFDFKEVTDEAVLKTKKVVINRAPVMSAWAYVVAERLGFARSEALSIGTYSSDSEEANWL